VPRQRLQLCLSQNHFPWPNQHMLTSLHPI
jgi:hypothetical protein